MYRKRVFAVLTLPGSNKFYTFLQKQYVANIFKCMHKHFWQKQIKEFWPCTLILAMKKSKKMWIFPIFEQIIKCWQSKFFLTINYLEKTEKNVAS